MAKTFAGTIKFSLGGSYNTTTDLANATQAVSIAKSIALTTGTGANQADLFWSDQRTLGASPDDLDLAGSLTDVYGATLTFVRIKMIYVFAAAANAADVVVGGDATAALVNWVGDATDVVNVRAGGAFMIAATDATAYPVTATTGDILQVNGTSGDIYDIAIVGASA